MLLPITAALSLGCWLVFKMTGGDIWWLDIPAHFFAGVALLELSRLVLRDWKKCFLFLFILAVAWEMIEGMEHPLRASDVWYDISDMTLGDTIKDVIVGMLGGLMHYYYSEKIILWWKKRTVLM